MQNTDILVQYRQRLLDGLKYSYKMGSNGMCTFAHVLLPHTPFIFKEDGSINDTAQYYQRENGPYLSQLKYTAKKISEIVHEIVANDPNAVILIQSDHGSRIKLQKFSLLNGEEPTKEEYKMMTSIMNILYYKGERIDIEGQSGYQTLNETVQKLFGYKDGYKNGYISDIEETYKIRDKLSLK